MIDSRGSKESCWKCTWNKPSHQEAAAVFIQKHLSTIKSRRSEGSSGLGRSVALRSWVWMPARVRPWLCHLLGVSSGCCFHFSEISVTELVRTEWGPARAAQYHAWHMARWIHASSFHAFVFPTLQANFLSSLPAHFFSLEKIPTKYLVVYWCLVTRGTLSLEGPFF